MQDFTKRIFFGIVIFALLFVAIPALLFLVPTPKERIYDCGMAEWHPDIPIEVREECRRLRANKKLTTT